VYEVQATTGGVQLWLSTGVADGVPAQPAGV
jgi:hypothetical protein